MQLFPLVLRETAPAPSCIESKNKNVFVCNICWQQCPLKYIGNISFNNIIWKYITVAIPFGVTGSTTCNELHPTKSKNKNVFMYNICWQKYIGNILFNNIIWKYIIAAIPFGVTGNTTCNKLHLAK